MGIKDRIISPTFVFIRQYEGEHLRGEAKPQPRERLGGGARQTYPITNFYHIDLYRIEKADEARGLGLEEIFADKRVIVAIEWAEKIKKLLPKKRIEVYFKYLGEHKRKIKIKK